MGIGQEPSSGDIDTSDQDSDADTAAGDVITNDDTMSEDELELELAGKPWPVASRSDVIHSSILSIVTSWIMTTILIFYKWNSSDFWHFGILSPKCFSEQARQGTELYIIDVNFGTCLHSNIFLLNKPVQRSLKNFNLFPRIDSNDFTLN